MNGNRRKEPFSVRPKHLLPLSLAQEISRTMPKVTIICSPVSGAKKGKEVVETRLAPRLRELGVDVTVVYTERSAHAVSLAAQYGSKDMAIISVGGDGTTNEVLQGLLESGKLGETKVGVLSQGTMNFFGVCAGLPSVDALPKLVAESSTRPCSLMRVDNGISPMISFEAAHFGLMPYKVCKGAQDWRFSLGPMFGCVRLQFATGCLELTTRARSIFLHLIMGNLLPKQNCQRGTLTMWPSDGSGPVRVEDEFFWVIVTHRNPYTGAVGRDLWVSWMPLSAFPGFPRMMGLFVFLGAGRSAADKRSGQRFSNRPCAFSRQIYNNKQSNSHRVRGPTARAGAGSTLAAPSIALAAT